jgi:hypothetical protein
MDALCSKWEQQEREKERVRKVEQAVMGWDEEYDVSVGNCIHFVKGIYQCPV